MSDPEIFGELDHPARLLMGPGPINVHPRVLRAMSVQLLGQFDPEFTAYMNQTMALYRQVFQTTNRWTFLIDGTSRAAIEAALVSVLAPGDDIVILNAGRFGLLLSEIADRCGARITLVEAAWGEVIAPEAVEAAVARVKPRLVACVHGDTSTTMAQPITALGEICRRHGSLLYVDATATLGGMDVPVGAWGADIVTAGLQKCMGGPPGSAPITISDGAAEHIFARRHVERGLATPGAASNAGQRIGSNYFDLAMVMDYWSEKRLNHHTEAASMLFAARECARVVLEEGLAKRFARHALAGAAMTAGVKAMGLEVYGDPAHKMANVTAILAPAGVDYDRVRARMRTDFEIEIGSAFGPLAGKVWRIGAMGVNARKDAVLTTLAAFEAILRTEGYAFTAGAGVDAAMAVYAGERGLNDNPRDLIGYGENPPHAAWPNGARIVVQFVLNYEEGAERSIQNGDEVSEYFLSEMVGAQPIAGMRHMSMESLYEYGSRAGFWRIRRLFDAYGLPLTVFGVAQAMAANPDAVEAMLASGWEIASHGYRWIDYQHFPEALEREHIARAIDIHTGVTGERPLGWYQGRTSPNTARLVAEEGGFVYDADSYADDLPYYDTQHGRPQLIVPYTLDTNDMRFVAPQGFNTGDQFFTYLRDAFDTLYAEGQTAPKMLSVGLHCRVVGRPARMAALKRFIDHVMAHERVWVARRIDVARHWLETHPYTDHKI